MMVKGEGIYAHMFEKAKTAKTGIVVDNNALQAKAQETVLRTAKNCPWRTYHC
jgi:hypothetical protein